VNIRTILKRIPHDDLLELVMRLIQSDKKVQEKALQLLKQQFQHRPSYELYKKAIAYAAPSMKEAVREELYALLTRQSFSSHVKAEIDYNEGNSKELLQYVTKTASFPIYSTLSKYERYLNERGQCQNSSFLTHSGFYRQERTDSVDLSTALFTGCKFH
jgi:hypothetical protein